ncbi:hypothetical protein SLS57_004881 [Botryosphaeria dothidea]
MRSALAISGFAALAAALPQSIDFDALLTQVVSTDIPVGTAAPTATYDSVTAVASAVAAATEDPLALSKRSLRRRDSCSTASSTDTAELFLANTAYTDASSGAGSLSDYNTAFTSQQGATEGSGYITYTLLNANFKPGVDTYDVSACASKCSTDPTCMGFNVFVERAPSCDPGTSGNPSNPASQALLKCSLWGLPVHKDTATNVGQWRGNDFHVVITASNGYNKKTFAPKTVAGFDGPTALKGAIQAKGYIGMRMFNVYDPAQCAALCTETTAFDKQHIQRTIVNDADHYSYDACNFFNVWILTDVNKPQGMVCSMYQDIHTVGEDTNVGQYRDDGYWSVTVSNGYALSKQDPGKSLVGK